MTKEPTPPPPRLERDFGIGEVLAWVMLSAVIVFGVLFVILLFLH